MPIEFHRGNRPGLADRVCVRFLRARRSVLAAAALSTLYAGGIESAADDVISNAWKISYPAASNQYHGVFLKVVALSADVCRYFHAISKAHAGDLAKRGVGLLGRNGLDLEAHAATLGARVEVADLALGLGRLAWVSDELIDRRHKDP